MTLEDFKEIISTHGTDPQRWPGAIRQSAEDFAASHPELVEPILQSELQLDKLLDNLQAEPGTDLLKQRILNMSDHIPQDHQRRSGSRWTSIAALMLAAFSIGVLGGRFTAPMAEYDTYDAINDTELLASAEELGLAEIYAWVQGEGS